MTAEGLASIARTNRRRQRLPTAQIPPESEKQFLQAVTDLARSLGWRVAHTFDSRRSEPGFPDLVMVSRVRRRIVYAELKREGGHLTAPQSDWLGDLEWCGAETYVWVPSDWPRIVEILTARTRP